MGRRRQRNRTALLPTEVLSTFSYVDSIGFRVRSRLPEDLFAEIQASLRHAHGWFNKPVLEKIRIPHSDHFQLYFWLHQPTRRAIELLRQYEPAKFYAVHVSLDLCVGTPRAASELEAFVLRHIHKEGEGRREGKAAKDGRGAKLPTWRLGDKTHVGHTYFWKFVDPESGEILERPGRRCSQIVVYSDLPSKVTGGSCVHVEYRVGGTVPLSNDRLPTPAAVLALDHREFWKKRLHLLSPPSGHRLERVVAEHLGKRTAPGTKKGAWEDRLSEAQEGLTRAFTGLSGDYRTAHGVDVAHALRESSLAGARSPLRLFDPVNSGWMLPPHGANEFWACSDRAQRETEGNGQW